MDTYKIEGNYPSAVSKLALLNSLHNCSLLCFTGVYDINGNPIYENDTCKVSKPNSYLNGTFVVKFCDKYSCFGWWNEETGRFVTKGNGQPYIIGQKNVEIIK